ncbi:hypothetical protein [uncultured Tateyamaria sp.]|uniref:hypothetical protein n=1 Tax=Tateyamaria sp. 1078 TaxID=3417464 RepID=UPI00262E8223|nr:hypothetical protein [uncultured Tateyamaria sp.]
MSRSITTVLSCLADALIDGRLDHITRYFAYPLPLYCNGELIVFGSPDTLKEALSMYRDAILAIGTVKMRPRLVAQGLPVRGYSSVWIEWDHLDAAGTCLRTNQVRYATYQGAMDLHPRIEIVDYTVTAFPELYESLPAVRTA